MTARYVSIVDGMKMAGLRLVLSAGAPGPWGEGAKAIFDIKQIPYVPVQQHVGTRDELLKGWTGQYAAPAAMFESERPRTTWHEILLLAQRLQPLPSLIPENASERALMVGLTQELCGEDGLGWHYRQYFLDAQLKSSGAPVTGYSDQMQILKSRYVETFEPADSLARVCAILKMLSEQLASNASRGRRYLVGSSLSAADIYWATFSNFIVPIAEDLCPMSQSYRDMGIWMGKLVANTLDSRLVEFRDRILHDHFKLPLWF